MRSRIAKTGADHRWPGLDAEPALAVVTLPIVAVVWLATRILKKRLLQGQE